MDGRAHHTSHIKRACSDLPREIDSLRTPLPVDVRIRTYTTEIEECVDMTIDHDDNIKLMLSVWSHI